MEELISVVVLTYHSSNTVIETLESIKDQTYPPIELIISDDHSADDTVKLVSEWLKIHKNRFINTVLSVNDRNEGISKNFNKALANCTGKWVKIIGGDDLLLHDCIENYHNQVLLDNGRFAIYQSREQVINDASVVLGELENERLHMKKISQYDNAQLQFKYLVRDDIRLSPTLFFKKDIFHKVGGCDERIRNIDDYPLKLKILRAGYLMGFLDKVTVQYRVHDSISHKKEEVYQPQHIKQKRLLKRLCCNPYISKMDLSYWISEGIDRLQEWGVICLFHNKRTFGAKVFLRILYDLYPRRWESVFLRHKMKHGVGSENQK